MDRRNPFPWRRVSIVAALLVGVADLPARGQTAGWIAVEASSRESRPGEAIRLEVSLRAPDGSAWKAKEPVRLRIQAPAELAVPAEVVVPAGQGSISFDVKPDREGAWTLGVSCGGWATGWERLVAVSPPPPPPAPPATDRWRSQGFGIIYSYQVEPTPQREIETDLDAARISKVIGSLGDPDFAGASAAQRLREQQFDAPMLDLRKRIGEATRDPGFLILSSSQPLAGQVYRLSGLPGQNEDLSIYVSGKTPQGGGGGSAATQAVQLGTVRLVALPDNGRLSPHSGRWQPFQISAEWLGEDRKLELRQGDLDIEVEVTRWEGAARPVLKPLSLRIPAGRASTRERVLLSSELGQKVKLVGSWQVVSQSELELEFLPRRATALAWSQPETLVSSLGPLRFPVEVALVDRAEDFGNPDRWLPAEEKLRLCVTAVARGGSPKEACGWIEKGETSGEVWLDLPSADTYRLRARAGGLRAITQGSIVVRFAWVLVGVALAGGLVGAGTGVLVYRRRAIVRPLVIGTVAAVVAVGLALFGLLDLLSQAWPLAAKLGSIPVGNAVGLFLIALLAGLAGETILRLLSFRKPAANRPAPGPSPAPPPPSRRAASPRRRGAAASAPGTNRKKRRPAKNL